ncbi:hypothetical protein C8Q76DRAFT_610095 [Earliella scabrosa]|nr:hypothetical protein C8Q76DRAFT_610095 [Earliella scabrosa]
MRKRPPIPVTDDGAKYLTVVHPYPSHPNMKLPAHRKLFSQWVVACIGDPCNFRAFYYRPSVGS